MKEKEFIKKGLTKKSENISDWYHDIVLRAGLADYSEVKGSMIIKPYGYAIWEHVQQTLDSWFKEGGVQNAYFPLFIPYSLLKKEKEHVEGFSPELAIVTHAGGEELAEPLVVRPTSETIMYETFSKWIQSYRDLPLLINQWCNVVRWEKRTYPFLRTTEFLWQEGHTVHTSEEGAMEMVLKALGWYKKFYKEHFAISPYVGLKSGSERFAGAKATYSVELVIPDGKALQAATSHNLSDHFAKVFDIQFLNEKGEKQYPHQTSWGLSTRSIGGLILSHGDDSGLVMPPRVAPHQVVILAIGSAEDSERSKIESVIQDYATELKKAGIRVVVDLDTTHSMGYRINEWELKGVPLRLEIGKREIADGKATAVRRDTFAKNQLDVKNLVSEVSSLLDKIQADLLAQSEKIKRELTVDVASYDDFKKTLIEHRSFIRAPWCEDAACEANIKEETKATSRILELDQIDQKESLSCFACGKPAFRRWLFAQAY
ncbi:MAG: proline--tRNA ligase [Patescibacteria group bacterium]